MTVTRITGLTADERALLLLALSLGALWEETVLQSLPDGPGLSPEDRAYARKTAQNARRMRKLREKILNAEAKEGG